MIRNIKRKNVWSLLLIISIFSCQREENTVIIEPEVQEEIIGMDASFIPELRDLNESVFDKDSIEVDFLDLIKTSGFNTVRFRIWHSPDNQHSGFSQVKAFADEIKSKNLKTFLNFHYSDTWTDPGHQEIPIAWSGLTFEQLKDSVFSYTKSVIREIEPDYVQLGNEINNGMLFPYGSVNNINQLKALLQQAIKAVREESPETKIMLHYAGFDQVTDFYSQFTSLDYDLIGLSYYPYWHGKDLDEVQSVLNLLASLFDKKIVIAEIAYPFNTLEGTDNYLVDGYQATADGQVEFIKRVQSFIDDISTGYGVCLWGGVTEAYLTPKPTSNGYYWENQAVLDYNNRFLPVMEALNK